MLASGFGLAEWIPTVDRSFTLGSRTHEEGAVDLPPPRHAGHLVAVREPRLRRAGVALARDRSRALIRASLGITAGMVLLAARLAVAHRLCRHHARRRPHPEAVEQVFEHSCGTCAPACGRWPCSRWWSRARLRRLARGAPARTADTVVRLAGLMLLLSSRPTAWSVGSPQCSSRGRRAALSTADGSHGGRHASCPRALPRARSGGAAFQPAALTPAGPPARCGAS